MSSGSDTIGAVRWKGGRGEGQQVEFKEEVSYLRPEDLVKAVIIHMFLDIWVENGRPNKGPIGLAVNYSFLYWGKRQ